MFQLLLIAIGHFFTKQYRFIHSSPKVRQYIRGFMDCGTVQDQQELLKGITMDAEAGS